MSTPLKVSYSYLENQFHEAKVDEILGAIKSVALRGDFTLGKEVYEFEERFAELQRVKYAIALNSGTAALIGILRAQGIGPGDEVITVPNSFIATCGAIACVGAKIVFVDVDDQYLMDLDQVEDAMTEKTRAILPVHLTGCPVDGDALRDIADRHRCVIVEDAAQAVCAEVNGVRVGNLGIAAEFSFHPLKNLNGWNDGGAVVTNDKKIADFLRSWRNHGMKNRDEVAFFAENERMHTIAAAVLNCVIGEAERITEARIAHARLYDELLWPLAPFVVLPPRSAHKRSVYHTYVIRIAGEDAASRDALQRYLREERGVDSKVHYPIPIHLQEAARHLGHKLGDFPRTELQARQILSLPVHQYLTEEQIRYVADSIREFRDTFFT